MNKRKLKSALKKATQCTIQHDGWTCATCFYAMDNSLDNADWQGLLLYRGQDNEIDLNNLPEDREASLQKIFDIATKLANPT